MTEKPAVHVPPEGIGIVLGVDRLLDMCRTTLNVTGDLTAAVYVARSEGSDLTPPAAGGAAGEVPRGTGGLDVTAEPARQFSPQEAQAAPG